MWINPIAKPVVKNYTRTTIEHHMHTFPGPAEEELVDILSIDRYLLPRRESSFLIRIQSQTMQSVGILPKDLAIFQRGRIPVNGDVVIAEIDNQWLMRIYQKDQNGARFVDSQGRVDKIPSESLPRIIGVITAMVRKYH